MNSIPFLLLALPPSYACFCLPSSTKYFSGVLSAMSTMVQLEIPHVNVMSKMDLVSTEADDNEDDEIHRDLER